jgi:dTDP-glucose 4,6-dehydratase
MRVFVTGGAGFIGSHFVRSVLTDEYPYLAGAEVTVFDKLTYAGNLANLAPVADSPRYAFVQGDICSAGDLDAALPGHDLIVNFAAESHVDRSISGGAADFVMTNVLGAQQVFAAALRHDVATVLHVSTDEVYGTLGESGSFSEETAYAPNSPYAASKAAADHLVRAYAHTYGLPALITNCSNNYGPFQFPEKLIPLMILNAVDGRPLPIYGDGGNVRDWLHVDDHCAGILAVLRGGRVGEKYNIGGGNERTNLEVVDRICDAVDALLPAATSRRSLETFVPDRPGHDRRYAIDAGKIRRDLGWAPTRAFEDGLRETVAWYVEHRGWCEQVQAGRYDRERLGLG